MNANKVFICYNAKRLMEEKEKLSNIEETEKTEIVSSNKKLEDQVNQYEKDAASGKKKNKKTIIKYILNMSLVLIVTVASIIITLWGNVDTILGILKNCDVKWLLVIVGIMVFSMAIRSFILFCFARLFTRRYNFLQGAACDQIGQFYNAVTPGASGGQIMQAYTYKKQGLPISSAVSALAMYSIMFQSALIIYNILAFILKFDLIMQIDVVEISFDAFTIKIPILILTLIGFVLNAGVILVVLLMGYWHGFHNFVMGPVIGFFGKIKILKNPDKTRENLRVQVENFKIEFRRLMTNIPFTILVLVSFGLYMTAKYSIPYFCGLALGSEHTSIKYFWDSVFLGNYHQMVTGLIPLPGSAGVSEYFFTKLFYNSTEPKDGFFYIFAQENTTKESYSLTIASLLIWRFITFIFPIIVAGITTAFYRASPKEEAYEREDIPNRGTFVDLQRQTYVMRKEEVESIVETQRLSRQAIMEKLFPDAKTRQAKKTTRVSKKKENDTTPGSVKAGKYSQVDIKEDE